MTRISECHQPQLERSILFDTHMSIPPLEYEHPVIAEERYRGHCYKAILEKNDRQMMLIEEDVFIYDHIREAQVVAVNNGNRQVGLS